MFSIRIESFFWKNLRNFESLNLPSGNTSLSGDSSLVLIQNGYGKTTTLYLLRSIFTKTKLDEKYIESGYKYRFPHDKWGGSNKAPSEFHVNLDIAGEKCRLGIRIDHLRKTQKFITWRAKLGGEKEGWFPPERFKTLFKDKPDLANLFLLDGETARELNRAAKSKVVKSSIQQVTNLAGLHELIGSSNTDGQILRVKTEKLADAMGDRGGKGKNLANTLDEVRSRINGSRRHLAEWEEKVSSIQNELSSLKDERDKLDSKIDGNSKELEKAKNLVSEVETDLTEISKEILRKLFNPALIYPEWEKTKRFHSSQAQAKLPKSVGRTWFEEIKGMKNCICGRSWDDKSIEHLNNHAEDYLDTRLMTYVKEMQDAVNKSSTGDSVGTLLNSIVQKQLDLSRKKTDVTNLRAKASDEDRENLSRLDREIGKLVERIPTEQNMLDYYGSKNPRQIKEQGWDINVYNNDGDVTRNITKIREIDNIYCLQIVEKSIQNEMSRFSDAAEIADGADMIYEILHQVLNEIETEVNEELENEMNYQLSKMVGVGMNGGLTVKISEKDGLKYFNPNGDLQESVNMAAELGGSYSFISALYKYAEVSIPLVLDTPLAGFGQGMTADWTRLVPKQFDQVIALINSSERNQLKGWYSNNPKVDCYLIRRKNEEITTGKPQEGTMILDNSIINFNDYETEVYGKEGGN